MGNFIELIKKRRSMRKFTTQPLSQDDVYTLLKAALMSPTSKRTNSWQFVVVDDKEILIRLSECKANGAAFVAESPLAVVVFGEPGRTDAWVEDTSIASIMMQLQAEDLGIGSCWVQVRNRFASDGTPASDIIRELLNVPHKYEPLSIIAFGHKGMERKPFNEENLQWEQVHINRFLEKTDPQE
ncbi:MAG TPA: nitroreductase family protein [Bacteroidaceae bacterium]|nr:nitroreductase family protein [Bacteroidaceae bacterium]